MNANPGFMCAFLRPERSYAMNNKAFAQKSDAEKRRRLSAVLRYGTGGTLTGEMTVRVLSKVSLNRQYTVKVFSDPKAFQKAVARARSEEIKTFMSVVFPRGEYRRAPVAAVVTPADQNKTRREILILAPHYTRKGVKTWAKTTRAGSPSRR
jgi:hypothetical protein